MAFRSGLRSAENIFSNELSRIAQRCSSQQGAAAGAHCTSQPCSEPAQRLVGIFSTCAHLAYNSTHFQYQSWK